MGLLDRSSRLRDAERRVLALTIAAGALMAERDQFKQDLTVSEDNRCYWQDRAHALQKDLLSEQGRHANTANAGRDYLETNDLLRVQLAQTERDLREARDAHRNAASSCRSLEESYERLNTDFQYAEDVIEKVVSEVKASWYAGRPANLGLLREVLYEYQTRNQPAESDTDIPF